MRKIEPFIFKDFSNSLENNEENFDNLSQNADSKAQNNHFSALKAHSGSEHKHPYELTASSFDYSKLANLARASHGSSSDLNALLTAPEKDAPLQPAPSIATEQEAPHKLPPEATAHSNSSPKTKLAEGSAENLESHHLTSEQTSVNPHNDQGAEVNAAATREEQTATDEEAQAEPQQVDMDAQEVSQSAEDILNNLQAAVAKLDQLWLQKETQALCFEIINSILHKISKQLTNYLPEELLWDIITDSLPNLAQSLETTLQLGPRSYLFVAKKIEELGYSVQEKGLNFTKYAKLSSILASTPSAERSPLNPAPLYKHLELDANAENMLDKQKNRLKSQQELSKIQFCTDLPMTLKLELAENMEAFDVNIQVGKDSFNFKKQRFLERIEELLEQTLLGN